MAKGDKTGASQPHIIHLGKPRKSAEAVEKEMKQDTHGAFLLKTAEEIRKKAADKTE